MINISNLKLEFQSNGEKEKIFSDLNLSVSKGGSLGIIGPNGCGKTTLLHLIAGLEESYSGKIEIATSRDKVALILQNIGLLPWKTVWKNATLGLDLGQKGSKAAVKEILKDLNLYSYRDSFPSQLSGGEKRKLGFARALAVDPVILLMDEPLVSLDELTREKLQDKIVDIWRERDLTMVIVTHDIEEVTFLGQQIAVLTAPPTSVKKLISNKHDPVKDFRRGEDFYQTVKTTRGELP